MRQGWFKFFNSAGELVGTAHYRDDLLNGQVLTFHRDLCVAELSYKDGLPHGPYRRIVPDGVYRVDNARWEEGTYQKGIPCGVLRLRDEQGVLVAMRNFGDGPINDESLRSCLQGGLSHAADWNHRACGLVARKRLAEAVCCLARAIGSGADPDALKTALARVAAPVTEEEAIRRADAVQNSSSARVLFGALLRGADPTRVFRRLAVLARGEASVAFLLTSIALREWPLSPIVSRAMRELREGDGEGALEDAELLVLSHEDDARVVKALATRALRARESHDSIVPPSESGEMPTIRRRVSHVAAYELSGT